MKLIQKWFESQITMQLADCVVYNCTKVFYPVYSYFLPERYPHGIFATGGAMPTQEKKTLGVSYLIPFKSCFKVFLVIKYTCVPCL